MSTTDGARESQSLSKRVVRTLLIGVVLILAAAGWRLTQTRAVQAGASHTPGVEHTNALIHSTSPYLLEHAHNPVDWVPWGDEALRRAAREHKPIFLSIGYLACHWCHVMMREDFEDKEIARILNDHFVCIKVDREERPDIDNQFLTAVQVMGQPGGWPLSVFLTPDGKPFYGGTYYAPSDFKRLLQQVVALYRTRPGAVQQMADQVAAAVKRDLAAQPGGAVSGNVLEAATANLKARYDPVHGGFGDAPKFPEAPALTFLLDRYRATGDHTLLEMVTHTLDQMAAGGIYDQLGGGFHRYSTDASWRVPHFEKMLYDQALLVPLYLDAYELTRRPIYRRIATETLEFVAREMRQRSGGFSSSLDADTEGQEGKYYLWTPAQIQSALDGDAAAFEAAYGVADVGDMDGGSVLHLAFSALTTPEKRFHESERLAVARKRLLEVRQHRVPPAVDDKIQASWNGLMIAAYARGYQVLKDPRYLSVAEQAAHFVLSHMVRDGQLMHSWRAGSVEAPGMLEDNAFLSDGLLALYDATGQRTWLDAAIERVNEMIARFWDQENGGFFSTATGGSLLDRGKDAQDNATPSGNSVAAMVMARLASDTGDAKWKSRALQTVQAFGPLLNHSPGAFPSLLTAYTALQANPGALAAGKVLLEIVSRPARPGETMRLSLRIVVAPGWHINAHHASESFLIPTVLSLSRGEGVSLVSVKYPPAERLRLPYAPEALQVYRGSVPLTVVIRRTGAAAPHRLHFVLSCQPCSDRVCLAPAAATLDVPF